MKTRFLIYALTGILGIISITAIIISVQENRIETVEVDILPGSASPEQQENVSPETIKVMIGVNNTIRWNNIDDTPHTLTPDHMYEGFSSGTELMKPGESYEITIEKSGVFEYHGQPHPWITGKIIALDKNGNLPTLEILEFDEIQKAGETISFVVRKTGIGDGSYTIHSKIIERDSGKLIDEYTYTASTKENESFEHEIKFPIRTSRIAVNESGDYVLQVESGTNTISKPFTVTR